MINERLPFENKMNMPRDQFENQQFPNNSINDMKIDLF